MGKLTHIDEQGNAVMVDVSGKDVTVREATAEGTIIVGAEILRLIWENGIAKGDVVTKIASPTANNLIKQDSSGKIADAGVAVADVQQKLGSGAFTSGNFRTSNASGFAQDAGYGLASDTNVDDMIHDVWGDPET